MIETIDQMIREAPLVAFLIATGSPVLGFGLWTIITLMKGPK